MENERPVVRRDVFVLNVMGIDGEQLKYHISKRMKFKKLMKNYSDNKNVDVNTIRFLWDGQRINHLDSPESLGMSSGDIVEVFRRQDGGL